MKQKILLTNIKIRQIVVFTSILFVFLAFHPFYLSVTEVIYDDKEKNIQISCKIFTDDFEKTLRSTSKTEIDLIHPKDKPLIEKYINDYVQKHLLLKVNFKNIQYHYVGYEIEEEAAWCYFETGKIEYPKNLEINNTILYEALPDQVNIVHAILNGKRKSAKVGFPDKLIQFEFD